MHDTKTIDFEQFYQFSGENNGQGVAMATLFIEQAQNYHEEFQIAYRNNDNHEWHDVAHKTKGMAGFSGAVKLQNICKIAQNKSQSSKQEKRNILDLITVEIKSAINEFQIYIEQQKH